MFEAVIFRPTIKVLTKFRVFFKYFFGCFVTVFHKNLIIDCTKFAVPTGQFFGENYEFFAPKSANLPPKI
jgi:hypothetical protein